MRKPLIVLLALVFSAVAQPWAAAIVLAQSTSANLPITVTNSTAPGFFVATTGLDSNNAGNNPALSQASPFATLGRCQTAMRSGSTKVCYVRTGSYTFASPLTLTSADNGETWQNYPPDGYGVTIQGAVSPVVGFNGVSNATVQGFNISSSSGMCTEVYGGATNVIIQNNNIGTCGSGGNTTQSAGIFVTANSSANIYDNYIHVEKIASASSPQAYDGVEVLTNTGTVNVKGNVITCSQNLIEFYQASNGHVVGNYGINPTGPGSGGGGGSSNTQFASNTGSPFDTNGSTVQNNYFDSKISGFAQCASHTEDELNFYYTFNATVSGNYMVGNVDQFGCAITADLSANNMQISSNIIGTQRCGIENVNGANTITGNKILILTNDYVGTNGFFYGMSTSTEGLGGTCGPTTVTNNTVAFEVAGTANGAWWQNDCTPYTTSGNVMDAHNTSGAAYLALNPLSSTNPPPLIPPQPFACVARSPFSTQTSLPSC
jgi:hypothetical protein